MYNKLIAKKRELRSNYGVNLNYWVTGNPILLAWAKRHSDTNRIFPHPLTNLVRIRDINIHLRAMSIDKPWLMKMGFKGVKAINDLENTFRGPSIRNQGLMITGVDGFDEQIDEFWKEVSEHYSFIGERDKAYLNWRYCDPRAGHFTVRQVEEDGELLGYSVLAINRYLEDYHIGFVVDLLTLPDRLDAAEALIADAVGYFDEKGVNAVNYLVVKNHSYEGISKRYGFLDSRIKFYMFFYLTSNRADFDVLERLSKHPAGRLFFSWGDHDSLPVGMPRYGVGNILLKFKRRVIQTSGSDRISPLSKSRLSWYCHHRLQRLK